MMFMFKYRATDGSNPNWFTRPVRPFNTADAARRAAVRWAAVMEGNSMPIEFKVYELVSDGRHGMIEGPEVK